MSVQLPVTGTGTADVVAATDDVAGVHYPFLKLADGALGGTEKIGGDAANGLDVDVTRLPGVAGDVAHDAADSGSPMKVGAQARTTNPAAVADADRVNLIADKVGRLVAVPAIRELVVQNSITLTDTTETELIAAGAAGVFHDLTLLVISNGGASGVRLDIRDDTAGTVRLSVWLPAGGGGAVIPFPVPFAQTASADAWTATVVGTSADVRVTACAVKNV